MDGLLNKAKNAVSGHSSSSGSQPDPNKEDYGDKALNAAEKKFGFQQSRETNERITDGARDLYEKQTGSKVNPKFSN